MAAGKAWINGGRKELPGSLILLDFSSKWNSVGRTEVGYSTSILPGIPLGSSYHTCPQGQPLPTNSQATWRQ